MPSLDGRLSPIFARQHDRQVVLGIGPFLAVHRNARIVDHQAIKPLQSQALGFLCVRIAAQAFQQEAQVVITYAQLILVIRIRRVFFNQVFLETDGLLICIFSLVGPAVDS